MRKTPAHSSRTVWVRCMRPRISSRYPICKGASTSPEKVRAFPTHSATTCLPGRVRRRGTMASAAEVPGISGEASRAILPFCEMRIPSQYNSEAHTAARQNRAHGLSESIGSGMKIVWRYHSMPVPWATSRAHRVPTAPTVQRESS